MKSKNRILKTVLFCAMFVQFNLYGGSVGGGGVPPAIAIEQHQLLQLKNNTLSGGLIRYAEHGYDPVYLRTESTNERSLSAVALESGNTTVFYTPTQVDQIQSKLSLSMARTMMTTMPGVLPILPQDLALKPKPRIDTVPESEIGEDMMEKIYFGPAVQ